MELFLYTLYKISCKFSNKIYIGVTSRTINQRFSHHKSSFKHGRDSHIKLYRAFAKYGPENFYIEEIERAETREEAYSREAELVDYYDSHHNGYNSAPGGKGGHLRTPEQIEELRIKMTGENNPMYGRPVTEERRRISSETAKKYHATETPERRKLRLERLSKSKTGKKMGEKFSKNASRIQKEFYDKNKVVMTVYRLESPSGQLYEIKGGHALEQFCKDNNLSRQILIKNILSGKGVKSGTLVGWKIQVEKTYLKIPK
jgi:group I intron endonuclease